jgi:glycosyltransferase involved in cell wall biosynthesis
MRPEELAPVRLWIFEHELFHYRLPFWDLLAEKGQGHFELSAFGETTDGAARGGGRRGYLRPMSVGGGLRSVGFTYQGAHALIQREKPEIVMVKADPRNRLSWQVPGLCRSYGGVSVLWSKVHSMSSLPTWLLQTMKRRLFRPYDLAFTYGPSSTRELIELGFDEHRVFTAHNTIDTRRIFGDWESICARATALRRAWGLERKKILLCVARLEPIKRHSDLLAAWPRLRELDPDLVLVLVGGGSLSAQIRDRAKQVDPHRIVFVGPVPESVDYDWIAAADVTIQCGSVGLAINQALASGKATIIADEPGVDAEIIRHGVTGWRYEKGNIGALVETVGMVLRDDADRERVTTRGREFIRDEVSIDRMVDSANACVNAAIELWQRRTRAS